MYFGPPVTGVNGVEREKYAWGVFYFRRDIKTTTEYLLYTLLSMLAEIGGYVGLLLGASLANIGSLNSFLLDKCFHKKTESINSAKAPMQKFKVQPMNNQRDFYNNNNHTDNYFWNKSLLNINTSSKI